MRFNNFAIMWRLPIYTLSFLGPTDDPVDGPG